MSKHACEFLPMFEICVDFDEVANASSAEKAADAYKGIQSTKETACCICGKRGPDNPEQEIFLVEPPRADPQRPLDISR